MIRDMIQSDTEQVLEMMRVFYASPAVFSNGSDEIFRNDIASCVGDCPYLEGYIFEHDEKILGYAMIAKSFSTELGKPCIWIEDLYIKLEARGMGIGKEFMAYINQKYSKYAMCLEVEEENQNAIRLYKKCGFEVWPYMEMKKNDRYD